MIFIMIRSLIRNIGRKEHKKGKIQDGLRGKIYVL